MLKRKSDFLTFCDGWGTSYEVVDRRLKRVKQNIIHFADQTVGERRYWDAYVAGTQIQKAVLVPYQADVDRGDVFVIEGDQYEVVQKDYRGNTMPQAWLLSLQSATVKYRGCDGN